MRQLRSFKGRLLLTSAILAIALLGFTLYANHLANNSFVEYQSVISRHSTFRQHIEDLKVKLQTAESHLYQYPLLLDGGLPEQIMSALDAALKGASILQNSRFIEQSNLLRQDILRLHRLLIRLHDDSTRLIEVLKSLESRFPGMNILLDTLQPTNMEFINYNNMALQDTEDNKVNPEKSHVYRLFADIRYNWAQQISSVRVFIANRSGVFGDPETSMRSNISNRDLYSERVRKNIDELQKYESKGSLTMVQADALKNMSQLWKSYERNFAHVKQIVYSDDWRSDITIVKNRLRPSLTEIWKTLAQIDHNLKQYFTENILKSQSTSRTLPTIIWLFTAVVYLLLLAAYFGFEYSIRRPMLEVAKALDAEGKGAYSYSAIKGNTEETAILVQAFQNMQDQVRSRQLRLETILDNAMEGIITFDSQGKIETFNLSAQKLFGYRADDVIGRNIDMLIPTKSDNNIVDFLASHKDDMLEKRTEQEFLAQRRDGSQFHMTMRVGEMLVGGKQLYTAIISDVSERKAIDEHLKNIAERDPLTGIGNRLRFMHELDRFVQHTPISRDAEYVLLYLDIDNFKYVNDTLGHHAGDRAIIEIAGLLTKHARAEDFVARIGGDEFGILLYNVDKSLIEKMATSYRNLLEEYKFRHYDTIIDLSCSIGACILAGNTGKEELLARADLACHVAKRSGKNRVHFYAAEDEQSLKDMTEEIRWVRLIKQALVQNKFELACQSIVDNSSGKISHYEILVRMRGEDDQLVLPTVFLPTAERFGMIQDIDAWVIKNAINILARQLVYKSDLKFAINLSGASFSDSSILDMIKMEIARNKILASSLTFEITETVAISNLNAAVEFLATLHKLGCETALDDFGAGYSSFAYLKDLPVDYVKIDGSFVCDIDRNESHRVMVRSMNEVAHAMGKKTVAEFVENEACLKVLKDIGVDYSQGFYLGKPEILAHENFLLKKDDKNSDNIIPLFRRR